MLGDSSERVSPWSVGGVGNIESENSEAGETGILFEGDGSMGDVILGALIVGNVVPGPGEGEGAGERRKEGGGASSKLMLAIWCARDVCPALSLLLLIGGKAEFCGDCG